MSFGYGNFGHSPFGETDWVEKIFWRRVPQRWRERDEIEGRVLRKFFASFEKEQRTIERTIRDLPRQRDPLYARASSVTESLTITGYEVEDKKGYGRALRAQCAGQLDRVEPGWICVIDGVEYRVVAVRSRHVPSVLWLDKTSVPSTTGVVKFQAPSMLHHLSADFGVKMDRNEPEDLQRSTVKSITNYLGWKGADRAYEIRGDVAGMDVQVRGLYRIGEAMLDVLPSSRTFEIDVHGETRAYTDVEPQGITWDDVPADSLADHLGYDTGDVFMYEDGGVLSDASEYAKCVAEVQVSACQQLSASAASGHGLAHGYQLEFSADTSDVDGLRWGPDFGVTIDGVDYPLDVVVDVDESGGTTEVVAVTGAVDVPSFSPGLYCLSYEPRDFFVPWWRRSHVLRIEISPQQDLVDHLGSASAIRRAIGRLVRKFRAGGAVIPIHVVVGEFVHLVDTDVELGAVEIEDQTGTSTGMTTVYPSEVFDLDDVDASPLDDNIVIVYEDT